MIFWGNTGAAEYDSCAPGQKRGNDLRIGGNDKPSEEDGEKYRTGFCKSNRKIRR